MTMLYDWDLVVAGAGPAGCVLAARVASRGERVLMLDRGGEPGEGRSWIVDVESNAFERAGVPFPTDEALWKEPERTSLLSPGGEHRLDLPPTPLTPVRNDIYVRQLAGWAVDEGAVLRSGVTVTGPLLSGGKVTGVVAREAGRGTEDITARIVADCTGIGGSVRRGLQDEFGISEPVSDPDIVIARREVRRISAEAALRAVEADRIPDRFRLDRTGAHGNYSVETVYLDVDGGFIDILVGIKPRGDVTTADERFERVVDELGFVEEPLFGDGAPIPIRRPLDVPVADGLVVVGDSACQVIPISGSGTASALIAADLASAAVTRALKAGSCTRADLWEYARSFQRGRGAVLAYYDVIRKHVDRLDKADLENLMRKKIMTSDEVISGLVPEIYLPGPLQLLRSALRGASMPGVITGVAAAGLKARRLSRHFERFPASYSREAITEWAGKIPAY